MRIQVVFLTALLAAGQVQAQEENGTNPAATRQPASNTVGADQPSGDEDDQSIMKPRTPKQAARNSMQPADDDADQSTMKPNNPPRRAPLSQQNQEEMPLEQNANDHY